MSRADDIRARHAAEDAARAAELELAELEDQLIALKANPGDGEALRAVKEQLREARRVSRLAREGA